MLKTFLKKFNNISTRNKLLISYILIVLIPVLLVGLILTEGMRRMAIEQAINESSNNVDRIKSRILELLRITVDISNKACVDQELETILLTDYRSNWDVVQAYMGYKEFVNYMRIYTEIEDIKFYAYNNSFFDSGQFVKITKDTSDASWFRSAVNSKSRFCWHYIYNTEKNGYRLSLVSFIKGVTSGKPLGVLVIGINPNYLNSMLKIEPFETIIVSDTGFIVAARNVSLEGKTIYEAGFGFLSGASTGIMEAKCKGELSKVIIKTFLPGPDNRDFRIVSVFPVRNIVAETEKISIMSLFIIACSLLLSFAMIIIFSYALSKRLKNLSRDMHRVALGDFEFAPVIEGEDEVGQLSRDLGTMVKSIKELIHEVYEVNLQKKQLAIRQREIRLKMLANQINPHFLFNALETIRMKAHCKGEVEIAGAVKLLGKIMRRNLEVDKEMVTLGEEVELVENYLEIQKFRFGDKINYEINFPDAVRDYKILPLIIQPIVENAVVHGLEGKGGKGNISVDFKISEDKLKISIEDNGRGISEEKLMEILEALNKSEDMTGKRIGLKNVYQRIKLHYGEEYGINVFSKLNEGTRIEIILPGKW